MNNAVMFSSATDEWATPQATFDSLHLEFRFNWDAAATQANAKCGAYNYFGPDHQHSEYRDALTMAWQDSYRRSRVWLNPPYSQCRAFMAKAAAEARHGAIVVALVPSRTDTRWFHDHVWDDVRHQPREKVEVRFLRGRLKFGGAANSAPFPSMIVIFRPYGAGGAMRGSRQNDEDDVARSTLS